MFHSTGGGATENNENVYVVRRPASGSPGVVSYLRGSPDRRDDGTAYDAAAPYATWSMKTYTRARRCRPGSRPTRGRTSGRSRRSTCATGASRAGSSASRSSARRGRRRSRATSSDRSSTRRARPATRCCAARCSTPHRSPDAASSRASAVSSPTRCPSTTAPAAPGRAPTGANPDPLMVAYHDDEWGTPVHDDVELFERLALESFQAGLSWSTILRKRDAFRAAFRGFDPAVVARVRRRRPGAADGRRRHRPQPRQDRRHDRQRRPLPRDRARRTGRSMPTSRRSCRARPRACRRRARTGDVPATTPASDALSADLRRRGFRFVGSTIVYAFMQSVGLVDDHVAGCFRYRG